MDEVHYQKLQHLKHCRFQVASWVKRFVRDTGSLSQDADLTPKQAYYIDLLYYLYRKQIGDFTGEKKPPFIHPSEAPIDPSKPPEKQNNTRSQRKIAEAQRRMEEWNDKVKSK